MEHLQHCTFDNVKGITIDYFAGEHTFDVLHEGVIKKLVVIEQFYYDHFTLIDDTTCDTFQIKIPESYAQDFIYIDYLRIMRIINQYVLEYRPEQNQLKEIKSQLSDSQYDKLFPRCVMGKKTCEKHSIEMKTCECAICCEPIKSRQHMTVTQCNHVFHKKCLKKWLTETCSTPTCPMCRQDVRPSKMKNVDMFKVSTPGLQSFQRMFLDDRLAINPSMYLRM